MNTTNSLNQNALDLAVSRHSNIATVDFLLQHGVAAKSQTLGVDALGKALENMESYNAMLENQNFLSTLALRLKGGDLGMLTDMPLVVDHLIRAGAPIEQSHLDQIKILKEINSDAYAKLVEIIPNLEKSL